MLELAGGADPARDVIRPAIPKLAHLRRHAVAAAGVKRLPALARNRTDEFENFAVRESPVRGHTQLQTRELCGREIERDDFIRGTGEQRKRIVAGGCDR